MTNKISQDGKTIVRFSGASRLSHGLHAVFFIILFITGCAIAFKSFGRLTGSDVLKSFTQIHRYVGIAFILPALILTVFSGKNLLRWLKDIFSFGKNDFGFIAAFPKEFFTGHSQIPPQGRFNGGEKLNSIIQLIGFFVMVITGIILFLGTASPQTLGWAVTVHSFCGLILGAAVMAHAYLGLLHPGSKASISGMISGKVPMEFAKTHHELWVKEVEAEEKENL